MKLVWEYIKGRSSGSRRALIAERLLLPLPDLSIARGWYAHSNSSTGKHHESHPPSTSFSCSLFLSQCPALYIIYVSPSFCLSLSLSVTSSSSCLSLFPLLHTGCHLPTIFPPRIGFIGLFHLHVKLL